MDQSLILYFSLLLFFGAGVLAAISGRRMQRELEKNWAEAAVEPLSALSRGFLDGRLIAPAAQTAIRSIQGRLGNASEGQLSVSDAPVTEGGLSMVDAAQGAVSVVPMFATEDEVPE